MNPAGWQVPRRQDAYDRDVGPHVLPAPLPGFPTGNRVGSVVSASLTPKPRGLQDLCEAHERVRPETFHVLLANGVVDLPRASGPV